jgi:diguanylate cyclase (GGDEF)-like protein
MNEFDLLFAAFVTIGMRPGKYDRIFSMKRVISAAGIILGLATACAAVPAPLTNLRAIAAVTNDEARQTPPVDFQATVTYSRGYENLLFVQDGDAAIFVRSPSGTQLAPGDRVEVRGKMQPSFRPVVNATSVTLLHHGPPPRPQPATFVQLIQSQYDTVLVTVRGRVRAADLIASGGSNPARSTRLQLITDGGHFEANLDNDNAEPLKDLLDADVEITGAAAGKFDDKMQQTGVVLYVSSLANIGILKRAPNDPWSLPVASMDRVLAVYHLDDLTPRVRVQGTITYYQPGSALVLQDGRKSLWVATHTREPLQIGDRADATGFPDTHERMLTLVDGEIKDSQVYAPITPEPLNWHQLGFWSSNSPDGHLYDLVSIEGQVVTEVREAAQDEYVLSADGRLFNAIYRHPPSNIGLAPMVHVPLGSRVRVAGICVIVDATTISPGEEVPFDILLRSFSDISVVAEPSLFNTQNLMRLVTILLVVVVLALFWAVTLNRKVRRQTTALSARIESEAAHERRMAQLEQRRSRILEDINGSRPLAEILEEITEMVSFRLDGTPCWCQVADGARLGHYPADPETLRLVTVEIPGRKGLSLGALSAGFHPGTLADPVETEALTLGSRLASLAIETRRVYNDLLHRSEFDLLTDIHNRFSLEKHLDKMIETARSNAGIFGLIYIDLDEFKQVNDMYGHRVGDLYLQEAAIRMKRQLRGHDMLARLGGDEFAVLFSMVPNRTVAEEIASRLEHCFDQPFEVEGYALRGSASVGLAIYPEDGTTRDSLLSASDAAMYVAKHTKQRTGRLPADQ